MIWARLHPVRRRVALWLCPELSASYPVLVVTPRGGGPVQPELDQVIRLGAILKSRAPAGRFTRFSEALGYALPPRDMPYEHPYRRKYNDALHMSGRWLQLKNNPPAQMREKTYRELMTFFADHWPADLPWPADIPRPPKSKTEETTDGR